MENRSHWSHIVLFRDLGHYLYISIQFGDAPLKSWLGLALRRQNSAFQNVFSDIAK